MFAENAVFQASTMGSDKESSESAESDSVVVVDREKPASEKTRQ